jgi:hypothetical protein
VVDNSVCSPKTRSSHSIIHIIFQTDLPQRRGAPEPAQFPGAIGSGTTGSGDLARLPQARASRGHAAGHLREVAYAEISAPQRRLLHRRVAHALEAMHAEDLDAVSGQLASHYEHAGMIEQALPYYQCAAAVAQREYASEDAISLPSRSLELLEQLPAGSKRDKQVLGLQFALAPLYRVTKGWATPELERVPDRAFAVCDTVGDDAQRAETL